MGVFFGTDGIRGVICDDLTFETALKCGNSLSRFCKNKKVIIAKDTRISGDYILTAVTLGLIRGGVSVTDIGIATTPSVAYLTKELNYDFGIMITASHNPFEHNGIKIFGNDGLKISECVERMIEKRFLQNVDVDISQLGQYHRNTDLLNLYHKFLINIGCDLSGKTVVLDCANGASYKIAPKVFKKLNCNLIVLGDKPNGLNINANCGSLHTQNLFKAVEKHGADFGFAFDGDADRIVVCDSEKIMNGDQILYILANYLNENYLLDNKAVVGTSQTNMAIENQLKENGIKLFRSDVGDKYVMEEIIKRNLVLGGEQSGHIIVKNYLQTGDGVLCALLLSKIAVEKKCKLSTMLVQELYPQINLNIFVKDKLRVMGSETLANAITYVNQELAGEGRALVRPSGTEQVLRVMIEAIDEHHAQLLANYLKNVIEKINQD